MGFSDGTGISWTICIQFATRSIQIKFLHAGCSFWHPTNSVSTEGNKHFKHSNYTHTHTHTRLTALCPGLPGWAGTRKVKSIWILLKKKTVRGNGISWAICTSAPRSRQITMPAPHRSVFLQARRPSCHPTNSVKALKANSSTVITLTKIVAKIDKSYSEIKSPHICCTCYFSALTLSTGWQEGQVCAIYRQRY